MADNLLNEIRKVSILLSLWISGYRNYFYLRCPCVNFSRETPRMQQSEWVPIVARGLLRRWTRTPKLRESVHDAFSRPAVVFVIILKDKPIIDRRLWALRCVSRSFYRFVNAYRAFKTQRLRLTFKNASREP